MRRVEAEPRRSARCGSWSGPAAAATLGGAAAAAARAPLLAAALALLAAVPAVGRPQAGSGAPPDVRLRAQAMEGASVAEGAYTLNRAVDDALARHPSVRGARARVEAASAAADAAAAARLPRVALDGGATRFEQPMVVAPLHGFDPARPPAFERTLVRGGLSAEYTVFDGGVRGARIAGERARAAAAESGAAADRGELLESVVRAYLDVRSSRAVVEAHDRRVAALGAELERARRLLEEGRTARVAELRAEAALGRARAERVRARTDLRVAERHLARLVGAQPARIRDARLAPAGSAESSGPLAFARPETAETARGGGLAERARRSNPAVVRARHHVRAAEAGRAAARAAWLPALSLGARYAVYGSGSGEFDGEWEGGVQLSYPLFTGGARGDEVRRAEAERRAARERLRLAELEAVGAVDRALAAARSAAARVEALEAAVERSEEVVRIERLALDEGAGVQTDYLAAEAELLSARSMLTEARAAEVVASVRAARAAGELSREWIARNLESEP